LKKLRVSLSFYILQYIGRKLNNIQGHSPKKKRSNIHNRENTAKGKITKNLAIKKEGIQPKEEGRKMTNPDQG